jgi:hypothetical protein
LAAPRNLPSPPPVSGASSANQDMSS